MSAPGASAEHKHSSGLFVREETEIFDFEAGDASEARVNYSGNSRWGWTKSTFIHWTPAKIQRAPLHSFSPWGEG